MYKRIDLRVAGVLGILLSAMTGLSWASEETALKQTFELSQKPVISQKPNIVIVIADDLGYAGLSSYGGDIATPHIDSIAEQGVQLTNFHTAAACAPTRAMLLTGVDSHLSGVGNLPELLAPEQVGVPGYEGRINEQVNTLPQILKAAGYRSYLSGKWHLGMTPEALPNAKGFDQSLILGESSATNWHYRSPNPIYQKLHFYKNDKAVEAPINQGFSTDFWTNTLIQQIDADVATGQPFFAVLSTQAVHAPLQAPEEYLTRFKNRYHEGWNKLREQIFTRQKALGLAPQGAVLAENNAIGEDTPEFMMPDWESLDSESKARYAKKMQVFAAMTANLDDNVGRLQSYLKDKGLYDNTLFIFMSDNGADPMDYEDGSPMSSWYHDNFDQSNDNMGRQGSFVTLGPAWAAATNTPLAYYKTFSAEGGVRTPMVVRLPGVIPANVRSDAFVYVEDIAPTILRLLGIEAPEVNTQGQPVLDMTGHNVLPLLAQQSVEAEEARIQVLELSGSRAIFSGEWKLVNNIALQDPHHWALYRYQTDISESEDLASRYPEVVKRLLLAYETEAKKRNIIELSKDYSVSKAILVNAWDKMDWSQRLSLVWIVIKTKVSSWWS